MDDLDVQLCLGLVSMRLQSKINATEHVNDVHTDSVQLWADNTEVSTDGGIADLVIDDMCDMPAGLMEWVLLMYPVTVHSATNGETAA